MKRMCSRGLLLMMMATLMACPSRADREADEVGIERSTHEEAVIPGDDWQPVPVVSGEPLEARELQALLDRLPPLQAEEADEVAFLRRAESLPVPLAGEPLEGEWPPDLSALAPSAEVEGPLTVRAFRPDGEVTPPFQVALVFDRPMIALGAVGELPIPEVEMTPAVAGRWRWLGTQTLVFQPSEPFPMATEFAVEVPVGTRGLQGDPMVAEERFTFSTPAPKVVSVFPTGGPRSADAAVLVVFDQPVHPETAGAIEINDGAQVPMTPLARDDLPEELERYESILEQRRGILLRPERSYRDGATVSVNVRGPIRSMEGPILGTESHRATFRVRGEFRITEAGCWRGECQPNQAIPVRLTNPVASGADLSGVEMSPEVKDLRVLNHGSNLSLQGDFQPRTTYQVTLPASLEDAFGQSLQGARTRSVQVGAYPSLVAGPSQPMVVQALSAEKSFPVAVAEVASFRSRVYRVTPDDWDAAQRYRRRQAEAFNLSPASSRIWRFSQQERQERRELAIDLSDALPEGRGHALVVLDQAEGYRGTPRWVFWVQRTDLAADVTADGRSLLVRVTRHSDGSAVAGAEVVDSRRGTVLGETDERGELEVPLRGTVEQLIVRDETDSLVIPGGGNVHWDGRWATSPTITEHLWGVIDDREMYKPGETVSLTGWIRTRENTPRADLEMSGRGELTYRVLDPRGAEIGSGTARMDRFGGFDVSFEIPEGANLGTATVVLTQGGSSHRHRFQIQEFRRPEYEVTLESSSGPHMVGESTRWEGLAEYYTGGALPGADSSWRFRESAATFRPPGWSHFSFGTFRPWWSPWGRGGSGDTESFEVLPEEFRRGLQDRQTDGSGRDVVSAVFESPERGMPRTVTATISVMDVNRQSWEASDAVLVHPGELYVGLRSERSFVRGQEPYVLELIAVDVDGEVVEGAPIEVKLFRRRGWQREESSEESCERRSGEEAVKCRFEGLSPGAYQVVATVTDSRGRRSESERTFWVAGQDRRGAQTAEEGQIVLIPEKDEVAVGETARLFVQAPFYPMDAVVELRRDGRYDRRHVRITAEDPVVEVEIKEEMIPNVYVSVMALSAGDAYQAEDFASGTINLPVDRDRRRLNVEVKPRESAVTPGAQVEVEAVVRDHQGDPVEDARVVLFAVDEAILAISGYDLLDLAELFYPTRQAGAQDVRSRSWLLLETEEMSEPSPDVDEGRRSPRTRAPARPRPAPAGAAMRAESAPSIDLLEGAPSGGRGGTPPAIQMREVFDALAFFRADLTTDGQGRVEVREQLPESLTRYRVMALAVEGPRRFGGGEETITARLPLMVRPSQPRFLNVDDEFEFPVVIQNQTTEEMVVDVALRSTTTLEWSEPPGRRVRVPAANRVEVRFGARAASAGTVRAQAVVASGPDSDAALVDFPVLTPATTEAFATYGSLFEEDVILQALQVPDKVYSQFGGLDVQTSSTQLQALTDALLYLVTYRFACTEQLASRILSVLALYDVLEAFDAPDLPSAGELRSALNGWVTQLARNQRGDGGFGFWESSDESWPFVTAHAAFALWQAEEAGVEIPMGVLNRAMVYLGNMELHVNRYQSARVQGSIEAYGLYVRHRMGRAEASELDRVVTRYGVERLSMEALGWMLPMASGTRWEERFRQRIENQVQETAATAEFQESYHSDAYRLLHTTRRTDGVVLDGLLQTDPDHHLVEKVVRGLLGHRSRGRWGNTQENVFILMALRRYFDEYEADEPDFIARAWLGEAQISEHAYSGRTTERHQVMVPMSYLKEQEEERLPLVLQRDGQGRMYYRVGVRYAPKDRNLAPLDEGFLVERTYEAVDDEDDVRRTEEGWEIRAGARVRVELSMTVPARRYHVALVDWLPAGFEPINTALAVSQVEEGLAGGSSTRRGWGWWFFSRPWFEHENLRDERVEAFASLVHHGTYTYSYVARATTPGTFIAMPAKAEEMYHPETFGRSSTEVVRIR